jgi:hypothetical protein
MDLNYVKLNGLLVQGVKYNTCLVPYMHMRARPLPHLYLRARLPSVEQDRCELVEERGEGLLEQRNRKAALAAGMHPAHRIDAVGPLRVHVGPHRVDNDLDALREPQRILHRQPHLRGTQGQYGRLAQNISANRPRLEAAPSLTWRW